MKPQLIGLVGFARAGKNSFAEFFGENTAGTLNCKYISFAYALRKELDTFLQKRLNISAFTEDPEEKEIIRPLLVCWGTQIMREKIDRDHWVKSIEKTVEINRKNNICSIITDVRFKNEILWIKKQKGISIWINRENTGPRNEDELKYTTPLKENCDFHFKWPNLENFELQGKELVEDFINKNNICPATILTNS